MAFQASLGTWLVPDLIGSFRQRYPQVRFDLRIRRRAGPGSRCPRRRRRRTVDAPCRRGRGDLAPARPRADPAAVAEGAPLCGSAPVQIAEVADDPFITLRSSSLLRAQLDRLCAHAGIEVRVALVAGDLPTARLCGVRTRRGHPFRPAGTPGRSSRPHRGCTISELADRTPNAPSGCPGTNIGGVCRLRNCSATMCWTGPTPASCLGRADSKRRGCPRDGFLSVSVAGYSSVSVAVLSAGGDGRAAARAADGACRSRPG